MADEPTVVTEPKNPTQAEWEKIYATVIDAWLLTKRKADPRAIQGFLAVACDLLPEGYNNAQEISKAFMLLAGAIEWSEAKQAAARQARRSAALQPAGQN